MKVKIQQNTAFRRNIKWMLIGSFSQTSLSGALLVLMGRGLGSSDFGVFSIIIGYVYVANLICDMRIQDVVVKLLWDFECTSHKTSKAYKHFIDLFVIEAFSKLIPCLALIILSPLLVQVANLPTSAEIIIIVASIGTYISKLGNGLSVGFLRILGRSDLNSYCGMVDLISRLFLTIFVMNLMEYNALTAVIILSISGILSNMLQWFLTFKRLQDIADELNLWNLIESIRRVRNYKDLLISNLGISMSDLMSKDLDVTLLAPLVHVEMVGLYKMAKNICLLSWRAIDPFYMALMPELIRLFSIGNTEEMKKLIYKSTYRLFYFALLLSIVTYIGFKFIGGSIFGENFLGAQEIMPWMLAGIVVSAAMVWGHPLSVALDRADLAFKGSLLGLVLGGLSFIILTPQYQLSGAGVAWSISLVSQFIFTSLASYWLLANYAKEDELK